MAVGEIFLSAFLQVLFEKLGSTGINLFLKRKKKTEYKIIKGWQKKLRVIEAVLSDAEKKQCQSNAIKLWLQDLQDLAYDLEDILDEIAIRARARLNDIIVNQELLQDDAGSCFASTTCNPSFNKVPRFLTCASGDSQSKSANYSKHFEQIGNRFQDILTQMGSLGLLPQTHSREKLREEWAGTSSLVREPVVYGRDDEKNEIIQRLLKDEPFYENYIVIPIVGKGGIGKTILAQAVYNDEQVKAHFDVKAWVCVSDMFDIKHVTTTVIISATHATHNFSDLNEAQEELKNLLDGKRCLVVLDDIWSDEYDPWDQFQTPFQAAAKGSRVIITTRIDRVAKNMLKRPNQSPIVYLKGLSDDCCWLLFKQHAVVDPDLIEMRNEIVRLFKGLPLAATALGGLLRKEKKSKWPKILKSNVWSEEGGVLPVLRLSYHHLSHHLKRLFAYCSIFPKNHEFTEEDVVLMWMAEGLLPAEEEDNMEDVGSSYFLDLVSRSLIEPSPSNKGYFIVHDLIHDVAQWAAGDICCTNKVDKISCRTRYFSFTEEVLTGLPWNFEKLGDVGSQLRTFAFFGSTFRGPPVQALGTIIGKFQCLRLLSLAYMNITELPNCIGNLKHLRHLDLTCNEIEELPESVSKLCNLQTLLLFDCRFLNKVLSNMSLLNELRHLEIYGTALSQMPMGIGKLTNLRTLNRFFLTAESGSRIRELKNLNCLGGSLTISELQNVVRSKDAKQARLNDKSGLEVLRMHWETSTLEFNDSIERDVLDQLQPHKSIQELYLNGYRASTFPAWLGDPFFTNIVVIRLQHCFRCECLPPLGKLPSLKELWVKSMRGIKTVGPEFYGVGFSNPFRALKILHFEFMRCWEEWFHPSLDDSDLFPSLEELEISECRLLRGNFPSHLPSLKKLEIDYCDELKVSLPSYLSLREMNIRKCRELASVAPIIRCSENLRLRDISHFTGIEGFSIKGLKTLVVANSSFVQVERYPAKQYLELVNCPKLQTLGPDNFGELNKLTHLTLENCEELTQFLENNFPSSLTHFRIHGNSSLKYLSRLSNQCKFLEELSICSSSLITVNNLPRTLQKLVIKDVDIEQSAKDWGLHLLTSLKCLQLIYPQSSVDAVEFIPDPDLCLPTSLIELEITGFINLKSVSCSSFSNLTQLSIEDCPKLESLGYSFPPAKLEEMNIIDCPLITQRCIPDPSGVIVIGYVTTIRYSYVENVSSV